MDILFLGASKYRFPGRAGQLQDAGATASLIAELGDNYETYHSAVREAFQHAGGIPIPTGKLQDLASYTERWARIQSLVIAEMGLRRARQVRSGGPAPREHGIHGPPVVDPSGGFTAATDPIPEPRIAEVDAGQGSSE